MPSPKENKHLPTQISPGLTVQTESVKASDLPEVIMYLNYNCCLNLIVSFSSSQVNIFKGFPGVSVVNYPATSAGDGLIPG